MTDLTVMEHYQALGRIVQSNLDVAWKLLDTSATFTINQWPLTQWSPEHSSHDERKIYTGGAEFLRDQFGVDITTHPEWKKKQEKWDDLDARIEAHNKHISELARAGKLTGICDNSTPVAFVATQGTPSFSVELARPGTEGREHA